MKWTWNWSPFISTLVAVFIMETLDNTSLIQVYYSSKYGRQWLLALAAWSAFVCTGVIGSAFSALRALSENATRSIELVFALLILILGVVTLSHSSIILAGWAKLSAFLQRHVADRFLGAMGEKPSSESKVPLEEEEEVEDSAVTEEVELAETRVDIVEVSHRRPKHASSKKVVAAAATAEDDAGGAATAAAVVAAPAAEEEAAAAKKEVPRREIVWWRLFLLVFITVFVLELPDKTMIMVATLAQSSDYPIAIFVGYACAMIAQSLIALVVGKGIGTAAEKYGERIELLVGCILFITGTAKIVIMIFVGDFTIDFFGGPDASSLLSSSF